MKVHQPCPHPPPSPTRGHAAAANHQTAMSGIHGWYTQTICRNHLIDPSHRPKSNEYKWFITMFALDMIKTNTGCCSWAWRDQPIDQVGPFLTSRLHELQAEVVYCQWQCTLLQTLTMSQPPGSHRPLHGLHLTANKVPHTRSCVGIGHSQRECSPLYRGTGYNYNRVAWWCKHIP